MIRKLGKKDERIIKSFFSLFDERIKKVLEVELKKDTGGIIEKYVTTSVEEVTGYMVLRWWAEVCHIDTLGIGKKYQGKGLGSELIKFAKERCEELNTKQINVCTTEENNLKFYLKNGFKVIGKLNGPYPPFDKERIYLKWVNKLV